MGTGTTRFRGLEAGMFVFVCRGWCWRLYQTWLIVVELSTIQLRATFTVEYTSLAKIVMLGPAEAGVCVVAVERRDQPVFVYIIMYIFNSIYLYIYIQIFFLIWWCWGPQAQLSLPRRKMRILFHSNLVHLYIYIFIQMNLNLY